MADEILENEIGTETPPNTGSETPPDNAFEEEKYYFTIYINNKYAFSVNTNNFPFIYLNMSDKGLRLYCGYTGEYIIAHTQNVGGNYGIKLRNGTITMIPSDGTSVEVLYSKCEYSESGTVWHKEFDVNVYLYTYGTMVDGSFINKCFIGDTQYSVYLGNNTAGGILLTR